MQKRTLSKDYLPGYYDLATGGVMQENEDDLLNAKREVAEEMGIVDPALTFHKAFRYADNTIKVWGNIYSLLYDG